MYDTKKKELRWNATYFDYAATMPDEDIKYSKNLIFVIFVHILATDIAYRKNIFVFFSITSKLSCLICFF